jgi:hypothetical protein
MFYSTRRVKLRKKTQIRIKTPAKPGHYLKKPFIKAFSNSRI